MNESERYKQTQKLIEAAESLPDKSHLTPVGLAIQFATLVVTLDEKGYSPKEIVSFIKKNSPLKNIPSKYPSITVKHVEFIIKESQL